VDNVQLEVSKHLLWNHDSGRDSACPTPSTLLACVCGGGGSRLIFLHDGSTAVEVALNIAFRKYLVDHGLTSQADNVQLEVSNMWPVTFSMQNHGLPKAHKPLDWTGCGGGGGVKDDPLR
jgi:hypothetical protein